MTMNPGSVKKERFYNLLPEYYRFRDATLSDGGSGVALENGPLRAFLDVLESEFQKLEAAAGAMLDNWFVETCDPHFFPFIADLVGLEKLAGKNDLNAIFRAYVGNAIAFRRRKGTPIALERAAHAATGWHCRLVEFRTTLAVTQSMRDPSSATGRSMDMRNSAELEFLGTPFESSSRTASLRGTRRRQAVADSESGRVRGKYNIGSIGVVLWRLGNYQITHAEPRRLARGCYTLHPLGVNCPVFNNPRSFDTWDKLAQPLTVPEPLRRQVLARELDLRRSGVKPSTAYFGADPVISFKLRYAGDADFTVVPAKDIYVRDLSLCEHSKHQGPGRRSIFFDPQLGRLQLPEDRVESVRVDYSYGFSADIGGGPYSHSIGLPPADSRNPCWVAVIISPDGLASTGADGPAEADSEWKQRFRLQQGAPTTELLSKEGGNTAFEIRRGNEAIIALLTRLVCSSTGTNIRPRPQFLQTLLADAGGDWRQLRRQLERMDRLGPRFGDSPEGLALLRARVVELLKDRWPGEDFKGVPVFPSLQEAIDEWRTLLAPHGIASMIRIADSSIYELKAVALSIENTSLTIEAFEGQSPAILGDFDVRGAGAQASLRVSGLRFDGTVRLRGTLRLSVSHCTIAPPRALVGAYRGAKFAIDSAQEGDALDLSAMTVEVSECLCGAIRLPREAALEINNSIVDGGSGNAICGLDDYGPLLAVSNSTIFGPVAVEAIVSACGIIFTQPVEVRDQYTGCVRFSYLPPGSVTPSRYRCVPSSAHPTFTSIHFGNPAYAQLGINCPGAFRYGNEDGDEVGVGHVLRPLVRRELLDDTVAEFLPVELVCEVSYAT
jgi:hypothetical protein